MTASSGAGRTPEFHVLRVCERLGLSEREFWRMDYESQVRLLAYDHLRRGDGPDTF